MLKHLFISTPFVAIVAIFLSYSFVFAVEPQENFDYWKKLLHYDGKQSMVTPNSFFLHEEGNTDYIAELGTTIELLNSEKGNLIACNYPARYLWIKDRGFDVPSFDIESCLELKEYVDGFQKDSLSLVFASEHIDSPASAFGHILLVFHDDDKPLLTADTIHFAAETSQDNFIKYAYMGLSGGYPGYFFRTPFYIIKNMYVIVEQRSLFFYQLNLSREQIKFLIYHLFELRKAEYKYYFIRENCAYQIARLLEIAYAHEHDDRHSMYVLPAEIVNFYNDRVVNQHTIEASLMRAQRIFDKMTSDERQTYSSAIKGTLPIQDNLPDKVKEVLAIKYEYMFRRYRRVLPDYDEAVRLKFNNSLPAPPLFNLDKNNNKNMLGLGSYMDSGSRGVFIQYRPIGRDIYENQLAKLQESHLTLLDTQLIVTDNMKVKLHRLDFISAKSIYNRSSISSVASWSVNFGINRQNSNNDAVLDLSFGVGRGYSGKYFGISLLIGSGLQDSDSEGVVYLKPSIELICYPVNNVKIGFAAFEKYGNRGRYDEVTVFLNKDFNRLSILAKYIISGSTSGDYLILALRRHF
ncbi:MAG TPA: Lnb N-terminal periplasmic domain-containing protein [Candidatus Brocadiaceae bacterium]